MANWAQLFLDNDFSVPIAQDQFSILCPFHEDSVQSCSINLDKGVWICFAGCGQGSLYGFFMKYLNLEYGDIRSKLQLSEANCDLNMFDEFSEVEEEMPEVPFPFQKNYVPRWIFDRGFNSSTLRRWGGSIDNFGSLVLPIHTEEAKLVGWLCSRKYGTPKYMYSKGLKKSKLLFGQYLIQEPADFICITEGSLDTMWLDQHGFNSVALLGAHLSRRQQELALKLPTKELVLCLDNDDAGRVGLEKAMTCLNPKFMVSYIKIPKEYKDVQEIRDSEELQEIINERTFF